VKEAKADGEIVVEEMSADIYSLNLEPHIRGIVSGDVHQHQNIGPQINAK